MFHDTCSVKITNVDAFIEVVGSKYNKERLHDILEKISRNPLILVKAKPDASDFYYSFFEDPGSISTINFLKGKHDEYKLGKCLMPKTINQVPVELRESLRTILKNTKDSYIRIGLWQEYGCNEWAINELFVQDHKSSSIKIPISKFLGESCG